MTRHDPVGVRNRILDATVECLADVGYAATTTLEVQRRTGLSRGTLQHHFRTRPQLVAAAVETIGAHRHAETAALAADRRSPRSLTETLMALHRIFTAPTYLAELELWTAARTDPDLRAALVPVERRLGHQIAEVLDNDFTQIPVTMRTAAMRVTVDYMRGLASTSALRTRPTRKAIESQIAPLIEVLEGLRHGDATPGAYGHTATDDEQAKELQ